MVGPSIITLLLPLCAAQWWDVDIQPPGIKTVDVTRENAGVSILCTATNTTSTVPLKWYDGDGQEIPEARSGGQRRFVFWKKANLELKITRPQTDVDSGNYTCRGTHDDGAVKEKSVQLIVYEGIQLTSPKQQYSLYGQNGRISCSSTTSLPRSTQFFFSNWTILAGDRYRVENDYVIITNFTPADEGLYRCSISLEGLAGDSKDYEIYLAAAVLPEFTGPVTIEPHEPKEGQDLQVTCHANARPNPSYQFFKIEGNATKLLPVNDTRNGTLLLKTVTQADDGSYLCVASNSWGNASKPFLVDVHSPLIITNATARVDPNAMEGPKGQLECAATGDPEPKLSWKRDGFYFHNATENGRIYTETKHSENKHEGSKSIVHMLVFRSLAPRDVGTYICEAHNEYAVINKSVDLIFEFKPDFSKQVATKYFAWSNTSTRLTCTATGNPEPVLSWLYNGTKIEADGDYEVLPSEPGQGIPVQVTSTLKIAITDSNKKRIIGNYTCRGENKHGRTEKQLEVVEAYLPAAPEVTVVNLKPTYLELSVAPPQDDGGQPVLEYLVKYAAVDSLDISYRHMTVTKSLSEPSRTHVRLKDLEVNTTYSISLAAITNVGRGSAANITASTLDVSAPGPVKVTSDNISSEVHQYLLSWLPPYSGGCNITGYNIEYAKVSMEANGSQMEPKYTKVHVRFPKSSHLFGDLDENTYYHVRISASNVIGQSEVTDFFFKTDLEKIKEYSLPAESTTSTLHSAEIRTKDFPLMVTIIVPVIVLVLVISIVVGVILSRKAQHKRRIIQMEILNDCEVCLEQASGKVISREIPDSKTKEENQPLPEPLRKVFEDTQRVHSWANAGDLSPPSSAC